MSADYGRASELFDRRHAIVVMEPMNGTSNESIIQSGVAAPEVFLTAFRIAMTARMIQASKIAACIKKNCGVNPKSGSSFISKFFPYRQE